MLLYPTKKYLHEQPYCQTLHILPVNPPCSRETSRCRPSKRASLNKQLSANGTPIKYAEARPTSTGRLQKRTCISFYLAYNTTHFCRVEQRRPLNVLKLYTYSPVRVVASSGYHASSPSRTPLHHTVVSFSPLRFLMVSASTLPSLPSSA